MSNRKVVNIYGGPGVGKSTTACALFAELKYEGYNTEYVSEYAKAATWEKRGEKVFRHQEYIFGKQHFNLSRVMEEVDFVITDSPILLTLIYTPTDYFLPSLSTVALEAHHSCESINILLKRSQERAYNPSGRHQDEEAAIVKDTEIENMLITNNIPYTSMHFNRSNVARICRLMKEKDWLKK